MAPETLPSDGLAITDDGRRRGRLMCVCNDIHYSELAFDTAEGIMNPAALPVTLMPDANQVSRPT